jgi:hypothetical protein
VAGLIEMAWVWLEIWLMTLSCRFVGWA